MFWQTIFIICGVVLSNAEEYQESLTKLRNKNSDSVNSASIIIKPSSFSDHHSREARVPYIYRRFAFKPRAIPLKEESQTERNHYANLNKTEILFPGNYIPIANEKGDEDDQFHGRAMTSIRSDEYQRRSLNDESIIEEPENFTEESASRRSLSYIFGTDGDDDDDYSELEEEELTDEERKKGFKKKKIKTKKLKKYMLPLLLAYKMKYFALVPVLISGLVLLVGATGLAGFFFALFAAVMGLQKGGY